MERHRTRTGNPRTVVLGMLGTQLDRGSGPRRWERWRPTVDLCRHEDLLVDRLELIASERYVDLVTQLGQDLRSISPDTELRVHDLHFEDPWDFEEVYGKLHDFARAYTFDPEHERYLVHMTTGTHVAQICLFLLTESRHLPAQLLQTSPPRHQRTSAPGTFSIIDLDLSRYDRLASRFQQEQREDLSFLKSGIETRSHGFNTLIERIERVATASRAPILLTGPTGAGKSQLARRIYELKRRRHQVDGPFVEVNCATIRGDGAMSTLFGHVRGAFTGAQSDRAGLLRGADRGILFLDEIAEIGIDEQAMLLRAIEERRFFPVGSDRELESDFQLLAGTNCDLGLAVREGRFREDLLARIDLWTFRLPGLRERPEDIEPNLDYELVRWEEREGSRVRMNREAREAFLRFATSTEAVWSGNFRDFNAAIVRMATLAAGGRIDLALVEDEIERLRNSWSSRDGAPASSGDGLEELLTTTMLEALDPFDRVQLAEAVRVCRRSRTLSAAGRELYRASRLRRKSPNDADRLRKYLARFGLHFEQIQPVP